MTARVANRGEVSDFLSLFSRFHRFPFLLFFLFSLLLFVLLSVFTSPPTTISTFSLFQSLHYSLHLLPLFSLHHPILPFFSTLEPYLIDYYSFRVDYTEFLVVLTYSQSS